MIVGAAVRFVGVAYLYLATWISCDQEHSRTCRHTKAPQMGRSFSGAGPAGEFQDHGPSHVGPIWIQRIPLRWRRDSDASSGFPLAPARCNMPVPSAPNCVGNLRQDSPRLTDYKGASTVGAMSRRSLLADVLPGSVVAVAGLTTISWSIAPRVAEATQMAQAVMVRPHRHMRSRHRRWSCWWQRGRRWWHWGHRICGWR